MRLEAEFLIAPLSVFVSLVGGRSRGFRNTCTVELSPVAFSRALDIRAPAHGLSIPIECKTTALPASVIAELCTILGRGRPFFCICRDIDDVRAFPRIYVGGR
jgi:hypothetical protein